MWDLPRDLVRDAVLDLAEGKNLAWDQVTSNKLSVRGLGDLPYSDMSLAEIASVLAFSSQSHFNHQFKKREGQTSREYRKSMMENTVKIHTTNQKNMI